MHEIQFVAPLNAVEQPSCYKDVQGSGSWSIQKNQTIMANFKRKPNPLDYICKDIPCSFKWKIPDCNHPGLQSLLWTFIKHFQVRFL